MSQRFKLYHCKSCSWVSTAIQGGWAMNPTCPDCQRGLSFIIFDKSEFTDVVAIVGRPVTLLELTH